MTVEQGTQPLAWPLIGSFLNLYYITMKSRVNEQNKNLEFAVTVVCIPFQAVKL